MTAKDFTKVREDVQIEGLRTNRKIDFVHIGTEEVEIESSYLPIKDSADDYMSKKQLAFFKKVLLNQKQDLLDKTLQTITDLNEDAGNKRMSEEGDFAAEEERILTELRTRDRYRKLIHKIEDALIRIETGEYGYCEESGEEIGIPRLMIRPIATLEIHRQEEHEKDEDIKEDSEYNHKLLNSDENASSSDGQI
ncbi:unnamed protein product [Rotaria magnacalcarata]|uniref:RNA polymerase-binding transcription factor DksA n=1 Tax=Rotaria magnacalcarata TaxID=392030 RepID=A0A816FI74_9BILA|nr:unnamed protein product [Rotaria magnacalcarata]CAF3788751.1 unnamed protein product [Rotaria magnacalcarata]